MNTAAKKLRVVHFIEGLGPGGAERLLYTNLKHLDPTRVESIVLTLFSHGDHWIEPIRQLGVRVETLGCSGYRDLRPGISRLISWLRRERPDLLHTHLWGANIVGRVAGRICGVPVISSIHNPDYEAEAWSDGSNVSLTKRRLIRELDRWTARFGCRRMIAVSDYVRQSAHHHLGFPLDRIDLLYNPIDTETFEQPAKRTRNEIFEELGLPQDSQVLLNVGRLTPQKGLLYAIQSLPLILKEFPNACLLSVGEGNDPQWLAKLKSEIQSTKTESNVHLLGARRDVGDLLRACDLFVFPSLHEGLGIALIEAMASGCACVASSTGPVPEVVHHGVDGWLVPPRDAQKLAEAVSTLLSDPELRTKLGSAARISALSRFRPESSAERLTEIYESTLSSVTPKAVKHSQAHSLEMKISVIVPARDEEKSIDTLLEGLLNQSLAPQEIVVTDGGSADSTPHIINRYIEQGAPIHLIQSGPALPGRARNLAASRAACDWLAFVDAGNTPERDWLRSLAQCAMNDPDSDAVFGSYQPVVDSLFKECAALAYIPPATRLNGGLIRGPSMVSALVRRDVWNEVGGFPEHLRSAEDLLFIRKIENAGFRIVHTPKAVVHWTIEGSLRETFRRFLVYSRNNIRAGLWNEWQAAIFSRYALIITLILPAFAIGWSWLIVPLTALLSMLIARGVVSIWRNRFCYPARLTRNIRRLFVLIPLIATLDAAAMFGSIQWLLGDKRHTAANTGSDDGA
jgi:glycosyltransferase involved in cell wall biosynthesis